MASRNPQQRFSRGRILEIAAVAAVIVLAALSWRMISDVSTALYRQAAPQGDPALHVIPDPAPEPAAAGPAPRTPPSQLGHTGYFWSERAFHYRTALMFAVDDYQDPHLLTRDTWQQHPDGVNAWREYTLLMEPVYGYLYRVLGDHRRPFVEFLLGLIPLVHVLIFLPLYAAARGFGAGRAAALLGVAFYASCTLGFVRLTGSLLLKEDFALLWAAGFLAAHAWAWRRGGGGLLAAAGILLVVTLASWHLSQFLLLVILAPAAWFWLRAGETPAGGTPAESTPAGGTPAGRTPTGRPRAMPAVYLGAGLLAGVTPSLLARGFWLSLPMAVLIAWAGAAWVQGRRGWRDERSGRAGWLFVVVAIVLGAGVSLNRAYTGDYDHVFGLFFQKIVHGFHKPDDPAALPFAVRIFWTSPFLTPTAAEVWAKLGCHVAWLPVLLVWAAAQLRRGVTDPARRAFWATIPVFMACWVLAERMGVVFLVFGAVGMALLAEAATGWLAGRGWSERRAALVTAGVFLVTPALNLGGNLDGNLGGMIRISREVSAGRPVALAVSDQATWGYRSDLFAWIVRNTPGPGSVLQGPAAAFLGKIDLCPQVLLYCERPVALNSQFENRRIRDRYQQYLQLLYGTDETALRDFARRLDVRYLVIDRTMATGDETGSTAYLAGVAGPLDQDMVAVRMHLRPQTLAHFRPVYDNPYFRVFRLADPTEGQGDARKSPPAPWTASHSLWWAGGNYTVRDGKLADLAGDRRRLGEFQAAADGLQDAQAGILAAVEQRWARARGHAGSRPDLMVLHRQFVQAKLAALTGAEIRGAPAPQDAPEPRSADALQAAIAARLAETDPTSGHSVVSALSALLGDAAAPRRGWLGWLAVQQGEPLHYATAGQLAALAGRYADAADLFARAAAFFDDPQTGRLPSRPGPMTRRLWDEVVTWRLAAGQVQAARAFATQVLEQAGDSGDDAAAAGAAASGPGFSNAGFLSKVSAIRGDFD